MPNPTDNKPNYPKAEDLMKQTLPATLQSKISPICPKGLKHNTRATSDRSLTHHSSPPTSRSARSWLSPQPGALLLNRDPIYLRFKNSTKKCHCWLAPESGSELERSKRARLLFGIKAQMTQDTCAEETRSPGSEVTVSRHRSPSPGQPHGRGRGSLGPPSSRFKGTRRPTTWHRSGSGVDQHPIKGQHKKVQPVYISATTNPNPNGPRL